jgi:hypothetical protein
MQCPHRGHKRNATERSAGLSAVSDGMDDIHVKQKVMRGWSIDKRKRVMAVDILHGFLSLPKVFRTLDIGQVWHEGRSRISSRRR